MLDIRQDGLTLDAADLSGFSGAVAIPDVHGAFDAFDLALRQAEERGRFVVQLGDLIDRGPYSPLCVERMLEVEERGLGRMVLGNHEVAFAEFVLSGTGGAVTRQETLLQFQEHGGGLLDRFVARILEGPFWLTVGDHLFVHAAFHAAMPGTGRADASLRAIAVDGYGTARERRAGKDARAWVDAVPEGLTVVVGHAVTPSRTVETVRGRRGGRAVFADTGFWSDPAGACPAVDLPGLVAPPAFRPA